MDMLSEGAFQDQCLPDPFERATLSLPQSSCSSRLTARLLAPELPAPERSYQFKVEQWDHGEDHVIWLIAVSNKRWLLRDGIRVVERYDPHSKRAISGPCARPCGTCCIVPVDGFFEWKAIRGQKAKQPYAIAMKDGAPFGIAGIWENWKDPAFGDWVRTFAIITTDANELVADIHDRMPVILSRYDYARWLGEEPDPRDLMRPFPAELMRMWPISTRVNKPENDDPSIVEPIEPATNAA
jgi:SOS response associated peptidase (SRAP)